MGGWWWPEDRRELELLEDVVTDQAQEIVELERERRQLIAALAERT